MSRDQKRTQVLRDVRKVMDQVKKLSNDDQLVVLAIVGDCISAEALKGHLSEGIIQRAKDFRDAIETIENVAVVSLNVVRGSCDNIQATVSKTESLQAKCLEDTRRYKDMTRANWEAAVDGSNKLSARVKRLANSIPFVGLVRKWAFSLLIVLALLIAGGMGYAIYEVRAINQSVIAVYWEMNYTQKDVKDIHNSVVKPSTRRTGK